MRFIHHRINTIEQLKDVPVSDGIEVDVRYHHNDLICHHDPFHHHETSHTSFSHLLEQWAHKGPLILNIKTEGIEDLCIELMTKHQIQEWFFLDLSMPYFVKYVDLATHNTIDGFSKDNLAVRFSEREPIEYALSFQGKVSWVWVDCFASLALDKETYSLLKDAGFKICLVSPELQGHSLDQIEVFKETLSGLSCDAVCTKRTDLWG